MNSLLGTAVISEQILLLIQQIIKESCLFSTAKNHDTARKPIYIEAVIVQAHVAESRLEQKLPVLFVKCSLLPSS